MNHVSVARVRVGIPILLVLFLSVLAWRSADATQPVSAQTLPTSALALRPIIIIASPTPGAAPDATAALPAPEPRIVVAYAAPLGVVLGPINLAEGVAPVGRYGGDWMQVERADRTRVWIFANDAPDLQSLAALQPDAMPPKPAVTPEPHYAPALAAAQSDPGQLVAPISDEGQRQLDATAALYSTLPTAGPMPQASTRKTCTTAQLRAPRGANCTLP